MSPKCYLCGTDRDLSRDHIPPKGYFPPPAPENLITVLCCRKCNVGFSKDDEAFRAWVTAPPDISPAGKWIQEEKVFKNTFERSPALVENINKAIREVTIDGAKVDLITFPRERANRFLVRLTKGLLTHYYPEFDRDSQTYEVTALTTRQSGWDAIATLRDAAEYDERGSGVFQFRRRVTLKPQRGYWMFVFYEASLFLVWHKPKTE